MSGKACQGLRKSPAHGFLLPEGSGRRPLTILPGHELELSSRMDSCGPDGRSFHLKGAVSALFSAFQLSLPESPPGSMTGN